MNTTSRIALLTSLAVVACHVFAEETRSRKLSLVENEATISIQQSGKTVLVYNKISPPVPSEIDPVYYRSGFLHPVPTPGGKVVTAMFPKDHAHQNGIFSAWVRTTYRDRSVDFWNLAAGTGRVLHDAVVSRTKTDKTIGFEVDLIHRATEEPAIDILRERWQITAHKTDGTYHCFDLHTCQHALTDTPLIVNQYHYGGIALRGPVRWVIPKVTKGDKRPENDFDPSAFLNDQGSDRKAGNHQRSRWVSLTGEIDGHVVSITVLGHRDNFRSPQPARLHPSKPYFCYAACVNEAFQIDQQHPFESRFRYLVTDEAPVPEWLNAQWDQWCETENEN